MAARAGRHLGLTPLTSPRELGLLEFLASASRADPSTLVFTRDPSLGRSCILDNSEANTYIEAPRKGGGTRQCNSHVNQKYFNERRGAGLSSWHRRRVPISNRYLNGCC